MARSPLTLCLAHHCLGQEGSLYAELPFKQGCSHFRTNLGPTVGGWRVYSWRLNQEARPEGTSRREGNAQEGGRGEDCYQELSFSFFRGERRPGQLVVPLATRAQNEAADQRTRVFALILHSPFKLERTSVPNSGSSSLEARRGAREPESKMRESCRRLFQAQNQAQSRAPGTGRFSETG